MNLPIVDGTGASIAPSVSESKFVKSVTGGGILITAKRNRAIRIMPSLHSSQIGAFRTGEEVIAIGRNKSGNWLQIERGWILVNPPASHKLYFQTDGDVMSLPIIDETAPIGSSSRPVTNTPATPTSRQPSRPVSNWNVSSIRSLVSRHTDDVRILDIKIANSATTIDYDLKPWPFVPNEQIANEVAFKIICAIRNGQRIPNTLKLNRTESLQK